MDFPVFARGASPLDSAGRQGVIEVGAPVDLSGITVRRGDYIIGDRMGVVVFEQGVAEEVIAKAEEKARGESVVREALNRGEDIGDVFDAHGIL